MEKYKNKKHMEKNKIIQQTKNDVKKKLENPDQKIINLSLILDKLEIKINEITELLKIISEQEYPSLDQILDIKKYCMFYVLEEKNITNYKKIGLTQKEIEKIQDVLLCDVGIKLNKDIEKQTKKFAKSIIELCEVKENLEIEIENQLKKNYVNLYTLTNTKIASKMIEISGSIEKLSKYPASTIQLLGAEKSFFKALKFNKNTPKYGVLYIHPLINKLPEKNKAKAARSLAAKISIAVKADVEKKDMSQELLKKINKKINELK